MDPKIATLIGTILQGTADKKFVWESTERKTEYKLRFQQGMVMVDKWTASDALSDQEEEMVDLSFYNSTGEVVDRLAYSAMSDAKDYRVVSNLHEQARRSCLKIDEILGRLFTEIEKKANS